MEGMSAQSPQFGPGAGKKAVHVKWAGKTIALGTFPSAEADEKCARAKALTRAWRSTMRPKPTREWVMMELERLEVRVVSGRLGRKGVDDEDEDDEPHKKVNIPSITDPALLRRDSLLSGRRDSLLGSRRDSISGLLSAADMAGSSMHRNSLGMFSGDAMDLMQRRSSSLGLSLLPDEIKRRNSSLNLSSVLDAGDPSIPPHRPLVGGGSAAAYEAARADHYTNLAAQKARNDEHQRRATGLSGIGGGQIGLSVNPNQHYEMLKLHHMNLLNEIQETTLMMNLYQQQQLQQQQQQLQQQADANSNDQMALLLQHQGLSVPGRMGSLGLGGGLNAATASGDMQALLRQQQQLLANSSVPSTNIKENKVSALEDEATLQQRLQELKADIARHQKEAEIIRKSNKSKEGEKRRLEDEDEDDDEGGNAKRTKSDDSDSS